MLVTIAPIVVVSRRAPRPKAPDLNELALRDTASWHHDVGLAFSHLDVELRITLVQVTEAKAPIKLMFGQKIAELVEELAIGVPSIFCIRKGSSPLSLRLVRTRTDLTVLLQRGAGNRS